MADFSPANVMITGLAKIELPEQEIRLCDGGFVYFDAEKYESADTDFGAIQSVDTIEERTGDEAPGGSLTFLPSSTAAAATLSNPSYQGARIRFWLGRVNAQTGLLEGTPDLVFDGELDTTTLRVGRSTRALDMSFMSIAERLFNIREGNVLSSRFHQSVWPGELGFNNTTGIGTVVAWGVEAPPSRGTSYSSGGGGVFGAIGGFARANAQLQ